MNLLNLFKRNSDIASAPYRATSGFDMNINDRGFTVPYRVKFAKHYVATDDINHYCRRSRSSDGYKRETALKELITRDLDPQASAYVLVALSDYVIQVSSLPLQATAKTKAELRKIVAENPRLVAFLDARIISYWNEYYRDTYAEYASYPPYNFLQTLKSN